MSFSDWNFIVYFLPAVILLFYIVPGKLKNLILFTGSAVFYYMNVKSAPVQMIFFILTILMDFYLGWTIYSYNEEERINLSNAGGAGSKPVHSKIAKRLLIIGIILHVLSLCIFKYSGFIIEEINKASGSSLVISILQPLGISFFTFQGISYLADVYMGRTAASGSLLKFSVYMLSFEQVIQGPIVRYGEVSNELKDKKKLSAGCFFTGLAEFVFGLGLKVIISNHIGKLWMEVKTIGFETIPVSLAWLGVVAYSFQLLFDFWGYSQMSIGLGRMLGFNIPVNFDYPYLSKTMSDFWRRWHMTLGRFFRDYIYIPMGGSRVGKLRLILNLFTVWFLTGIWHGAGYNFMIWGIGLFVIICLEKFVYGRFLENSKVIGHIYMIILIPLSWAVFAVEDFTQLGLLFGKLFPFFGAAPAGDVANVANAANAAYGLTEAAAEVAVEGAAASSFMTVFPKYAVYLVLSIIFCFRFPEKLFKMIKSNIVKGIILAAIFALCMVSVYNGTGDTFMYARF